MNEVSRYLQVVSDNFRALQSQSDIIARAAGCVGESLRGGGTVFFCGNGGSAADSQHLAAELVGRYKCERASLSAVALTVDSSALTAIANDYGYDEVFARQLSGLGRAGDILVAISTSGNSPNVIKALECARAKGIASIGLSGEGGGRMACYCDILIAVPHRDTNHIQEMHIAIGHMICDLVESEFVGGSE